MSTCCKKERERENLDLAYLDIILLTVALCRLCCLAKNPVLVLDLYLS